MSRFDQGIPCCDNYPNTFFVSFVLLFAFIIYFLFGFQCSVNHQDRGEKDYGTFL